jgi:hypothetical protein
LLLDDLAEALVDGTRKQLKVAPIVKTIFRPQ